MRSADVWRLVSGKTALGGLFDRRSDFYQFGLCCPAGYAQHIDTRWASHSPLDVRHAGWHALFVRQRDRETDYCVVPNYV